jgi:hypothetical protein
VGAAINWVPTWPLPEVSVVGTTDVPRIDDAIPMAFELLPVYPNPFNPSVNVQYTLNKPGMTTLRVYNIIGQQVVTALDNVFQEASIHKVTINMSAYTSGIYFCVLEQNGQRSVQKMMLLK